MYCRYCGENNPDEAVFCKNCGKKLKEEVKQPEVITHTNNQNNNQNRQNNSNQYEQKKNER